jgi:hypothetical protein
MAHRSGTYGSSPEELGKTFGKKRMFQRLLLDWTEMLQGILTNDPMLQLFIESQRLVSIMLESKKS